MSIVTLNTTAGSIKIQLASDQAPKTVKNFLHYCESGFYDNTIFHRIIKNFMVQGGGLTEDMSEKSSSASIENEANNGLKNTLGTIAMARTSDPHSASSQFFINVADNPFLDFTSETVDGFGYCVFGHVVEGLDIVKKMSLSETGTRAYHSDVPLETITIESVECLECVTS
jgi:peptidyl-prolyl cis-trans isomerase B (cyclophilin B)